MKTRLTIAALMLGCAMIMAACEKETNDDLVRIPEGALMLTTEGFQGNGNTKTSVSGTSVQWVGGESVNINNSDYTVIVNSSGQAYVDASGISAGSAIHGYYGCEINEGRLSDNPTVTVPNSYTSSYSDGNQILPLPMVAYSSTKGSTVKFQHITAAVKVMIKNEMSGKTIVLDQVTVTSTAYKLSGTVSVAHAEAPSTPTVNPQTSTRNSVTVTLSGSPTVAYNAIGEVQVPILPIGNTGKLIIEVICHDNADASRVYTFSKEVDAVALGRNVMGSIGFSTSGGNMETTHEVDLSSLVSDYEAQDGDILYGTLDGNYQVVVNDDATITLRGVVIEADHGAGIECNANTTIIIEENTNSITSTDDTDYPAIYIATGKTLTINGSGTLTVSSAYGAGIGGGYDIGCGNIVINCSGRIYATGGYGAGIGSGNASCGDITIYDGMINASSTFKGAGIGCGPDAASCGDILISGGNITATGDEQAAGIGSGSRTDDGTPICGNITINGGYHTKIVGGNYAAAIGTGLASECGDITISSPAQCKILTKGTYATYSIGPGTGGTCGDVEVMETSGNYTGTSFGF